MQISAMTKKRETLTAQLDTLRRKLGEEQTLNKALSQKVRELAGGGAMRQIVVHSPSIVCAQPKPLKIITECFSVDQKDGSASFGPSFDIGTPNQEIKNTATRGPGPRILKYAKFN